MHKLAYLPFLACLLSAAPQSTDRVTVTFDDLQPGAAKQGQLTVEAKDMVVTISGPALTIIDLFAFAGDSNVRGNALLANVWPQNDGIMVKFSQPVSDVSIVAGDFGSDDDGPLRLRGFDCEGKEVGTAEAAWSIERHPPFAPLRVSGRQLCSAHFTSGGPYAGSAFLDNLSFVPL